MTITEEKSEFWPNILRAAESDPRDVKSIRGASGYSHPVVALGVDESRKRVVMISGESDARSAALAQGDVQAAMPSVKVVMARPLAVNLGHAAKLFSQTLGSIKIGRKELEWIGQNKEEFEERMKTATGEIGNVVARFAVSPFSSASLSLVAVIKDAIQQLSLLEVEKEGTDPGGESASIPTFNLQRLSVLDPAEADRYMGVCSIPLYEFSEEDVEHLKSGPDVERSRDILRRYDILQYFFPAPDQLALGLLERGSPSVRILVDRLKCTPGEGHPFGPLELLDSRILVEKIIPALEEKGLVVEGEIGIEVSPEGQKHRAEVRFKPREGLISKLSRIFSVKVDVSLKDLFK